MEYVNSAMVKQLVDKLIYEISKCDDPPLDGAQLGNIAIAIPASFWIADDGGEMFWLVVVLDKTAGRSAFVLLPIRSTPSDLSAIAAAKGIALKSGQAMKAHRYITKVRDPRFHVTVWHGTGQSCSDIMCPQSMAEREGDTDVTVTTPEGHAVSGNMLRFVAEKFSKTKTYFGPPKPAIH